MVSFGEVVVVVTLAGLLLRKKELVPMARLMGSTFGKLVGTLQGLRLRYETMYKGTQLSELHSNVRKGMDDLRTVAYDLSSLSPARSTTYLNSGMVYFLVRLWHLILQK